MNISRSGSGVVIFSAIYALSCHALPSGGSTDSSIVREVSSCSELTRSVDRDVCSRHLPAFKALIREKNNQVFLSTSSPGTSSDASSGIPPTSPPMSEPIPETIKIIKISASTQKPGHEFFETSNPTLFIFDAERSPGKGQAAVYELPLSEFITGDGKRINSFHLPDNSAFVGNSADILPEFVIEGVLQNHFVMSAPHHDSVYYLANIKINSRNPLDKSVSTATAATGQSDTIPTTLRCSPTGIMDLRGAGIFVADNIRVVVVPADNEMGIKPIYLGCACYDGRGTEANFIYRFMHSEFDLLQDVQKLTGIQSAALNVECFEQTGQVHLTLKNTKTVIAVPTETDTPRSGSLPGSQQSRSVLFSMNLWPRENILSFVDATCNSVVDQHDNDLSIDSAHPADPYHYMGDVFGSNNCSNIKMVNGPFGLKNREQAWGWISVDDTDQHSCTTLFEKVYRTGFAPVRTWARAGFDVKCDSSVPTPGSSPAFIPDAGDTGAMFMNNIETAESQRLERLATWEKVGLGAGFSILNQAITQTWFHLSKLIKQAWIRHTSQVLAATLGLGLPALPLLPECIIGLRRKSGHNPSGDPGLLRRPDLYQPGNLLATSSVTQGSFAELAVSIAHDGRWPTHDHTSITGEEQADHFITRDGITFAGTHLILDFWGAEKLDHPALMEQALRDAVAKAGATLLHIHLHRFEPNGGISGVAILAESHISVHTWPERDFAAFDIFVCGDAQPGLAIPVLKAAFNPDSVNMVEHLRGQVLSESE
ncbi:adenosylmethionine decarboxylase [Endozoicomonas sp. ALB032]|uniref:adenosylmethionine decarboxylase n=1 Tax=Endozoicomonas sp. ALB032 TaxID=3403082 RepID=UPI003BB5B0E8